VRKVRKLLFIAVCLLYSTAFGAVNTTVSGNITVQGLSINAPNPLGVDGLTFYANYRDAYNGINADFGAGSRLATFTCVRTGTGNSTGTYIDSAGIIQAAAATDNIPRYGQGYYNATGFYAINKGVMIEAAGTNLIQDSYFSIITNQWVAVVGSGGTAAIAADNTYTNPYGGGQILKFTGTKVGDLVRIQVTNNYFTTVVGTKYTLSYLLRGSGTVQIRFNDGAAQFGTNITLTDTWAQYQATFTAATAASSTTGIYIAANNAVTCYMATAQVEANPYATSFIPTTTASSTRRAETLKYLTLNNRNGNTESLFIKVTPCSTFANDNIARYLTAADAPTRQIRKISTSVNMRCNIDGTQIMDTSGVTLSENNSYIVCLICYGSTADVNNEIYVGAVSYGTVLIIPRMFGALLFL
jgi:hypothetical protein